MIISSRDPGLPPRDYLKKSGGLMRDMTIHDFDMARFMLAQLQEQMNLSYLFIAHDLSVVEHISDRVAVMYLGRIVELATDKELYQNPLHPYSRALLSAVPIPDPEIQRKKILLQGDVPSPINPPSGCSFHTRCPECKEACSQQEPTLQDMGDGHWVACHL